MHTVMIHPATYENCNDAVNRAFDLFPVEVKHKTVLLKPNALRASRAEEGIVTHPALVRAVVEKLESLEAGQIIVGDNPGMMSYGANEETFRRSGLMEAAKGYYRNIGTEPIETKLKSGSGGRLSVSRAVVDADVFISLPKFKTHGLTIVTGGIKNSYGIIPGAMKARLHCETGNAFRFSQMMVDIFCLRVPEFFILDAVVGMEGNGPASADLREMGLIMASDNAVALDATMARMMGLNPETLPFLRIARERQLGSYEERSVRTMDDYHPISDFKLPPSAQNYHEIATGEGEFFQSRVRVRPKVDPSLCTGCATCVEQCPVSALFMEGDLPEVEQESCIACFCCQEICPEKAMKLC